MRKRPTQLLVTSINVTCAVSLVPSQSGALRSVAKNAGLRAWSVRRRITRETASLSMAYSPEHDRLSTARFDSAADRILGVVSKAPYPSGFLQDSQSSSTTKVLRRRTV